MLNRQLILAIRPEALDASQPPASRAPIQRHDDIKGSDPMNPNKALWEKGDFTRIAESMRESGEALVRRLGIKTGMKVLDLGCGDGTTAVPAAKLGADVLGVDIAQEPG
jgi:2-polyprenyl-3-methyl-5-hydroxy-6-metoxy-1,4-benzoquinol methylase